MPGGDQTGPMGQGSMTGRGQGFCAGFNNPGNMNRGPGAGRGFGGGRGGGWRHRHWFQATGLTGWQRAAQGWPAWGNCGRFFQSFFGAGKATQEQELGLLQHQAAQLKDSLDEIHRRMEELAALAPAKPAVETAK